MTAKLTAAEKARRAKARNKAAKETPKNDGVQTPKDVESEKTLDDHMVIVIRALWKIIKTSQEELGENNVKAWYPALRAEIEDILNE